MITTTSLVEATVNLSTSSQYISFDDGIIGSLVVAKAGSNATFVGTPTQVIGAQGNGYNFSNSSALNTTLNFRNIVNGSNAINFWIKNVRNNTGLDFIFSYVDAGGYYSPAMYIGSGKFVYNLDSQSPAGNLVFEFANQSLFNGSWHMITITTGGGYHCANYSVYIDGVLGNIVCTTDTISTLDTTHMVRSPWFANRNSMGSASNGFYGGLDELSTWDYNLSSANVTDLFNFNFNFATTTLNLSFISPTPSNNSVLLVNSSVINVSGSSSMTGCLLNLSGVIYNMTNVTGNVFTYNLTQLNNTLYEYYVNCSIGSTFNVTERRYFNVYMLKNTLIFDDRYSVNGSVNSYYLNSETITNVFNVTGNMSNVISYDLGIYDNLGNLVDQALSSAQTYNFTTMQTQSINPYTINGTLRTIFGNYSTEIRTFYVVNISNVTVDNPCGMRISVDNASVHPINISFNWTTPYFTPIMNDPNFDLYLCNALDICYSIATNVGYSNPLYDLSDIYSNVNFLTNTNYTIRVDTIVTDVLFEARGTNLSSYTRSICEISMCSPLWSRVSTSCSANQELIIYEDVNACSIPYNVPLDNGTYTGCQTSNQISFDPTQLELIILFSLILILIVVSIILGVKVHPLFFSLTSVLFIALSIYLGTQTVFTPSTILIVFGYVMGAIFLGTALFYKKSE